MAPCRRDRPQGSQAAGEGRWLSVEATRLTNDGGVPELTCPPDGHGAAQREDADARLQGRCAHRRPEGSRTNNGAHRVQRLDVTPTFKDSGGRGHCKCHLWGAKPQCRPRAALGDKHMATPTTEVDRWGRRWPPQTERRGGRHPHTWVLLTLCLDLTANTA